MHGHGIVQCSCTSGHFPPAHHRCQGAIQAGDEPGADVDDDDEAAESEAATNDEEVEEVDKDRLRIEFRAVASVRILY